MSDPIGELETAVSELMDAGLAPRLVYQPIVDIARLRVVGYEALSRFPGPLRASPDRWFAAAARVDRAIELEAIVIDKALAARVDLPANCFLTINVAPEALVSARVQELLQRNDLSRVVVELTEHSEVSDYEIVLRAVAQVRELGGFIGVDDVGAGYASLHRILAVRPDFVKLDRELISGLHNDEAKAALVEMFGGFTSRLDSWVVAEGIEQHDELHRLVQLGVPLGQGYLLGRPAPEMGSLDISPTAITSAVAAAPKSSIARLTHACLTAPLDSPDRDLLTALTGCSALPLIILLDSSGRPAQFAQQTGPAMVERRAVLQVLDSTDQREALRRAMTRPRPSRFDPLACCDMSGAFRGIVPVERLIEALIVD
ncbi:EAL domain-containing protein [Gordonia polyisoprenivorans]|uniref:EAL domain-containing protein n=1 Tax=Gordonia polyisoprenivorans TaxID=84595 RepID=UPI001FCC1DA2|nr:EAL domain-containing protein [Gordonia polyisoprenivorans]